MAEQIEVLKPKRKPDLLDFFPKTLYRPQAGIVRLVGIGRAELVVVNNLNIICLLYTSPSPRDS